MIWRISTRECGSSPLTRGKPGRRAGHTVARGLIPAHAGKTIGRARAAIWRAGSSPLTRGKHQARSRGLDAGGLIPAHAGKTRWCNFGGSCTWAHPRSRGENQNVWQMSCFRLGSSPLTRGKLRRRVQFVASAGLIPAHAGKTDGTLDRTLMIWAHPRSRGENSALVLVSIM